MGLLTSAGERHEIVSDSLPRKMVNNNVLVRMDWIPDDNTVYKTESGFELILAGGEWSEASRMARFGKVEMVPSCLTSEMEWETDIEIEPGDIVYFGKMASANCPVLTVGESVYYILKYEDIIMRIRDGQIYPVNGYCIVEKVTETYATDGLDLSFCVHHNKKLGVVRYYGASNRSYKTTASVDAEVHEGDEVVFEGNFWGALEDSMFAKLDKELGYVQRCWIVGKL